MVVVFTCLFPLVFQDDKFMLSYEYIQPNLLSKGTAYLYFLSEYVRMYVLSILFDMRMYVAYMS